MRNIIALFLAELPCLACIFIAGLLAYKDLHYWGWFLLGAVCLTVTHFKSSDDKDKADKAK